MATPETVLLSNNERHREYTGANKFHKAGYYGERVIAATGESWSLEKYNPGGLVLDPLGRGSGINDHPMRTAATFFQFAPKARLVMLNMGAGSFNDPDKCYIRFADESLPIIQEMGIANQFCSFTQSYNATTKAMYEEAMAKVPNFKLWWSMGNDDEDSYNRITDIRSMFGVGAYKIMVDGDIVPEYFTSESSTTDFAAPDMIYSIISSLDGASASPHSGTSFASPTAAALSCLVDDFFIDKTGHPLSRDKMYQFMKDHCEDIGDPGIDESMGYGAIRLPEPEEIDLDNYADTNTDTNPTIPGTVPDKYEKHPATEEAILHSENSGYRSNTGVSKFHKAGYYGERVIMGTGESWDVGNFNPAGLVYTPFGNGPGWGNLQYKHGPSTAAAFFQVAPKAKLFQLSKIHNARTGKNCYCGLERYCMDVIKECNILGCFCSFNMICDKYLSELYTDLLDELKYFNLVVSAGNDYGDDYCDIMMCDAVTGVGACYKDGSKWKTESFTSVSDYVDFAAPDRFTLKFDAEKDTIIEYGKSSGSSFSAPWLLGQMALIDDFFIDKTGKPLTYQKMREFLNDYAVDIGDEGKDDKSGLGVVVLPDPSEIEIDKYAEYTSDTPVIDPVEPEEPDVPDTPDEPEEPEKPVNERDKYKEIIDTTLADNVYVTEIPYQSIREIGFAQCKQPTETVESWYNRQDDKPQIVVNGGLFNMGNGTNIQSFIENGIEQNYQNNFEGLGTKKDNLAHLVFGIDKDGDWYDFMSAYPVLVREGVAATSFDKANEINYNAARTALGVNKNGDVIILTVDKPGATLNKLAVMMADQGAYYAINLDGGGSVYKLRFGQVANSPTEKRMIDNVFYVKLKEIDDMSENPSVVELDNIDPGVYYATQPIDFKAGVDSSEDDPANVIGKIAKGDQLEVISTSEWINKRWALVEWQYQRGFIEYIDGILVADMPLPAIMRVENDIDDSLVKKSKVVVDKVDGNEYRIAATAVYNMDTQMYDVTNIKDIYAAAEDLSYVCYYEGTVVPDEGEPVEPVDPDIGGEGDEPENPDTDLFPAVYKVNPNMVNTVLNVRESYPDGKVIATLTPNTEIVVLAMLENNAWAEIEFDGGVAYVAASYIIFSHAVGEEPEEPVDPEEPDTPDEPDVPVEDEEIELPEIRKMIVGVITSPAKNVMLGDIVWVQEMNEDDTVTVVYNLGEYMIPTKVPSECVALIGEMNSDEEEEDPVDPPVEDDPDKNPPELDEIALSVDLYVVSNMEGAVVYGKNDAGEFIPANMMLEPGIIGMVTELSEDGKYAAFRTAITIPVETYWVSVNDIALLFSLEEPSNPPVEEPEEPSDTEYPHIDALADKESIRDCYRDGVEFVLDAGIMNPNDNNQFNPHGTVTRDMLATVVYRSFMAMCGENLPDDNKNDDEFIEVPIGEEN